MAYVMTKEGVAAGARVAVGAALARGDQPEQIVDRIFEILQESGWVPAATGVIRATTHDAMIAAGWECTYQKRGLAFARDAGPVYVACKVGDDVIVSADDPVAVAEAELVKLITLAENGLPQDGGCVTAGARS